MEEKGYYYQPESNSAINTEFLQAAFRCDIDGMRCALCRGADVNAREKDMNEKFSRTALYQLAMNGYKWGEEYIKFLLKYNPDLYLKYDYSRDNINHRYRQGTLLEAAEYYANSFKNNRCYDRLNYIRNLYPNCKCKNFVPIDNYLDKEKRIEQLEQELRQIKSECYCNRRCSRCK